jgi:hypothetical protein
MARLEKRISFFPVIIAGCLYSAAALFPQEAESGPSQEGTIPAALLQPQRGEAPRFPQDVVIGELGPGEAQGEAYFFARALLSALIAENRDSAALSSLDGDFLEDIFASLKEITPRTYHLGGGREEPDGATSFLFRFIGREQGVSGELYLRAEGERWLPEDILLEEPRDISAGGDAYQYDFSPYERFF